MVYTKAKAVAAGEVKGTVYVDRNTNNYKDDGEGIGDVYVRIYKIEYKTPSAPLAFAYTDHKGEYSFSGLDTAKFYKVFISVPSNLYLTTANPMIISFPGTTTRVVDFQLSTTNYLIPTPTKAPIPTGTSIIEGTIYVDINKNRIREGSEPLTSLPLKVRVESGNSMKSDITARDGRYRFANLPAGTYDVGMVEYPQNVQVITKNPFRVVMGGLTETVNFGIYSASIPTIPPTPTPTPLVAQPYIRGLVFSDDGDGIYQEGESPYIDGGTVNLWWELKNPTDDKKYDSRPSQLRADGTYAFENLDLTTKYLVQLRVPSGYLLKTPRDEFSLPGKTVNFGIKAR